MLGGKKKYKCKFEVKVEKIEGLPDKVKGSPFRVEYARGKDHTGISRTLTMTSKNMAVNYSFKFESNLLFEEKKGARKFSEKSLTFQVVAEKSKDVKKDTNIGKAEFDLATVAVPGEFEAKQRIECHGKDKSDTKCVLVVSFKTEVIKIDGKKLVKKDPSKPSTSAAKGAKAGDDPYDDLPDFGDDPGAAAAAGGRTVQVDGQEYDLQTDMDLSEGGMDSDGDAKTENDYLSDSDEKADPFEQDAELTEDEKKLAKKHEEEEAEAKKKADADAKKKSDAEAEKKAEADKKAAADAEKKSSDEKKTKEEEKKRKEEEEKKRKEEEKKKKEDEKRAKEEEDKRKKDEEKKRKEEEKRVKEEEEKRKKQEKADLKAGIVPSVSASSIAAASANASSSPSAPNSARDTKDAKDTKDTKSSSKSTDVSSATVGSAAGSAALEAKLKQVQEERDQAQAEVKRLTESLEDEKSRITTLKKELKSNDTTIKELESKLKREESKSDDLEADVRRLSERGGVASAASAVSASASASTASSDASEISWLEGQLRKVRGENEELRTEVDDLTHRLHVQEDIVEQHDAGYAAKCIADLETENAKLRKKLDDADLLKGDLLQELKHRQSERTIRVDQHHKDVEAGTATPEEVTGYKRHSRQTSLESSGSAATSPRTNGNSTAPSAKKAANAKTETVSKPAAKEEKKKPAISMDDDSAPPASTTRSGSKRAGGSSIVPIAEDSENAFASADNSAALAAMETRLKHVENIESYLYNAKMEYDEDGWATAAQQMSDYIARAQRALHRKEQHSESAHSLLVHVLSAIYGQTQRHSEDLDVLVGLFQWCVTLLQQLQRESDTLEDAPAGSYMTWAVDIENCGCVLTFDAMIDAQEQMSSGKFQVEKSFDDNAADATPGEAFLKLLDQLTSYTYTLIFGCLQTVIDEQRLTDLFFGQTAQLAAALNPNNPRANGGRKPAPPRPMASFTAQLDVFLSSARRHRLPKVIEAQMLGQFFYWCSCTIVNALVRSQEHCSGTVGMSLKVAVSHVEQWISQNSPRKLSGWIEEQFAATREAANVLTIDKHIFQSIDALEGIFMTLNIAQIHKLLTQFQPDDFAPDAVPRTTLDVLRNTVNKTNAKVTYLDGTVLVGLN